MNFKQPIELYIVWKKEFAEGLEIANGLYKLFCRNVSSPFDASVGIPVYYRFEPTENGMPIPIEANEAKRCMIVLLIDNEFLLDERFQDYADELVKNEQENKNVRVFPISFTKHFVKCRPAITAKNIVRLHDEKLLEILNQDSKGFLRTSMLHEAARFLMNLNVLVSEKIAEAPIKLFISHSKHDDTVKYAMDFKAFVDGKSQLKTFFDVNDLEYGSDFEVELNKGIGECVLVVFQSDSYSNREWCRI